MKLEQMARHIAAEPIPISTPMPLMQEAARRYQITLDDVKYAIRETGGIDPDPMTIEDLSTKNRVMDGRSILM